MRKHRTSTCLGDAWCKLSELSIVLDIGRSQNGLFLSNSWPQINAVHNTLKKGQTAAGKFNYLSSSPLQTLHHSNDVRTETNNLWWVISATKTSTNIDANSHRQLAFSRGCRKCRHCSSSNNIIHIDASPPTLTIQSVIVRQQGRVSIRTICQSAESSKLWSAFSPPIPSTEPPTGVYLILCGTVHNCKIFV